MKTSPAQFEIMVTFMEQHEDLTKRSSNANGKMVVMMQWESLTEMLNSDGSGDIKNTDKWKKVWSDFKNNTKKKAARLYRAVRGTGDGPACHTKLTDLEKRVLNLIGVQAATGLALEEAVLSQNMQIHRNEAPSQASAISTPSPYISRHSDHSYFVECPEPCNEPSMMIHSQNAPSSSQSARPACAFMEIEVEDTHLQSPTPPVITPPLPSSTFHVENLGATQQPAVSGQTTPRRVRPMRSLGTPRRRVRLAHTEQAMQLFLRTDEAWKDLKKRQHEDYMDLRREQTRVREMEVQAQGEWRQLGHRALDILDKLVNKYCKH